MAYQLHLPKAQRRFPYTRKPMPEGNYDWQKISNKLFLALLYDIEMHGAENQYNPAHMLQDPGHPYYALMINYLEQAQEKLRSIPVSELLEHIAEPTPAGRLMIAHSRMYVRKNPFTGFPCLEMNDPWNQLTEFELLAVFLGQEFNRIHMVLSDIPKKDKESLQWYTEGMPPELVAHRNVRARNWDNFYDDVIFCVSGGYPDELAQAYARMYVMLP